MFFKIAPLGDVNWSGFGSSHQIEMTFVTSFFLNNAELKLDVFYCHTLLKDGSPGRFILDIIIFFDLYQQKLTN